MSAMSVKLYLRARRIKNYEAESLLAWLQTRRIRNSAQEKWNYSQKTKVCAKVVF